jgi:hypothetical protein
MRLPLRALRLTAPRPAAVQDASHYSRPGLRRRRRGAVPAAACLGARACRRPRIRANPLAPCPLRTRAVARAPWSLSVSAYPCVPLSAPYQAFAPIAPMAVGARSSTLPSVSSTAPPPRARGRECVQTPDYSRACVVLWCGFGESRTASA